MKNKYDSSVIFLYAMGKEQLLPHDFRKQIPYSTISTWRKNDYGNYIGHEFRSFFDSSVDIAQVKYKYLQLKKTVAGLARSWVTLSHIILPLVKAAGNDKKSQLSVLNAINTMRRHLGLEKTLKYMGISK